MQSERNALAIAAADGSPQKSRGIHERIADLEMPVSVLQNRLLEKQSALNQARRTLETLEFEIANEARRAAREARFAELKQQGEQAAARINEKVRSLLTEDLPTLDDVRDSLLREFSGSPSRSLVRELTATLRDGSFLREKRRLLRDGWTVRGDIRLDVQTSAQKSERASEKRTRRHLLAELVHIRHIVYEDTNRAKPGTCPCVGRVLLFCSRRRRYPHRAAHELLAPDGQAAHRDAHSVGGIAPIRQIFRLDKSRHAESVVSRSTDGSAPAAAKPMTAPTAGPPPNIVEAMQTVFEKTFKRGLLRGDTWESWRAFLAAVFALPMDAETLATYKKRTGRDDVPTEQFREVFAIVDRRGGKSQIAALVSTYLATHRDYTEVLGPGETGVVMLLAADQKQAKNLLRYVNAFFEAPALKRLVIGRTAECITLARRVYRGAHLVVSDGARLYHRRGDLR